jgi:hypothetical protein
MRKITLVLFAVLIAFNCSAQDYQKYKTLVDEARKFYDGKEYIKSGQKYAEAFKVVRNGVQTFDRLAAAASWAQADLPDSAFNQLFKAAQDSSFTYYNYLIVHQPGLNPLHSDKRWDMVIEAVKINFARKEKDLDMELVAILDSVYQDDQLCQQRYSEIQAKYGRQSEELNSFSIIMNSKYSLNLIRVKKILNERGWLGINIIGHYGNLALFLVIQHSDLASQEKYLPMMRDAVKKGNASGANLALLEDRVALRQGKKQIYGTQLAFDEETGVSYVQPLEDPDNVNKRRAEAGLERFEDYLLRNGIKWDPEEYKKILPLIESKQKK